MKNFTVKRVVENCLIIFIALMALLCLAFPLCYVSYKHINIRAPLSETGFQLLDFTSKIIQGQDYNWLIIFMGIFNWIELIVTIILITISIVSLFMENSKRKKIQLIIFLIVLCFSILYLIESSIFINNVDVDHDDYSVTTLAWVSLLIIGILIVAYWIVRKFLPDKEIEFKTELEVELEMKKVELLVKLNELYSADLLTKEEFEFKKKKILE